METNATNGKIIFSAWYNLMNLGSRNQAYFIQPYIGGGEVPGVQDKIHNYGSCFEKPPKGRGPHPWFHATKTVKPVSTWINGPTGLGLLEGEWTFTKQELWQLPRYWTAVKWPTFGYQYSYYYSLGKKVYEMAYAWDYRAVGQVSGSSVSAIYAFGGTGYRNCSTLEQLLTILWDNMWRTQRSSVTGYTGYVTWSTPPHDWRAFVFSLGQKAAYEYFIEMQDLFGWFVLPHNLSGGCGRAYISALGDLPEITCNNIANGLELLSGAIGIAKALKGGGLLKMIANSLKESKRPAQLWLKYRYQYCTTNLDVHELISFSNRMDEINDLIPKSINCRGSYTDRLGTVYRCSLTYSMSEFISKTPKLEKYGIELNSVNAWDMIPWSFVVDWFLHIGDTLELLDSYKRSFRYNPTKVWYSFTTYCDDEVCYCRLPGSGRCPTPSLESRTTRGKTIFMRVADFLSLFLA